MSIILTAAQRRATIFHIAQFLELTTYPKVSRYQAEKIAEHLQHLALSPDDLIINVQISSSEAIRRTRIAITMDLKEKQDVESNR